VGVGMTLVRCLGFKSELHIPTIVAGPVLRLHMITIDVREPPDVRFPEVGALGVEEVVVRALARNTGDCVLAKGGHAGAGFG